MKRNKCLRGLSLLVVEDEAFVAMALRDTLLTAGAGGVTVAMTLRDAEAASERARFDAAVLDIRLPDGTSHELALNLIRQGTKVVFHSGHADIEMLKQFPNMGFCQKPTHPEMLIDLISQIVAGGRDAA